MTTREEFIAKLKESIDDWNKNIDKLEEKIQAAEAESREELEKTLQNLRKQRDAARSDLHKLQAASAEAFEDMREGLETAWNSISLSFREALSRFIG